MVTMYKTKPLTAPHQAGSPQVSPNEFLSSSHKPHTTSNSSLSTPPSPRPTGTAPLSQPAEAARGQRPLPTLTEASKGSRAAYCNSLVTGLLASPSPVCRRAARASRVTPPLKSLRSTPSQLRCQHHEPTRPRLGRLTASPSALSPPPPTVPWPHWPLAAPGAGHLPSACTASESWSKVTSVVRPFRAILATANPSCLTHVTLPRATPWVSCLACQPAHGFYLFRSLL